MWWVSCAPLRPGHDLLSTHHMLSRSRPISCLGWDHVARVWCHLFHIWGPQSRLWHFYLPSLLLCQLPSSVSSLWCVTRQIQKTVLKQRNKETNEWPKKRKGIIKERKRTGELRSSWIPVSVTFKTEWFTFTPMNLSCNLSLSRLGSRPAEELLGNKWLRRSVLVIPATFTFLPPVTPFHCLSEWSV